MKALHGHTKVELFNANTKKLFFKTEKDNIITNGTQEFFETIPFVSTINIMNNTLFPARDNLFKGCFLFNEALEEDAENYTFPASADALLVGHAGDTVSDGRLNTRGDFNEQESGETSNGYKYVWDFGTNDANGTIACVCLTNRAAGFNGRIYDTYRANNSTNTGAGSTPSTYRGLAAGDIITVSDTIIPTNEHIVKLEEVADGAILTTARITTASNINLKKYKIVTNMIALDSKVMTFELLSNENITVIADDITNNASTVSYCEDNGILYFIRIQTTNNAFVTWLSKLNLSSLTYTRSITAQVVVQGYRQYTAYYDAYVVRNGRIYSWCTPTQGSNVPYYVYSLDVATLMDFEIYTNTEQRIEKSGSYLNLGDVMYIYKACNGDIMTPMYIIDANDDVIAKDAYVSEAEGNFGDRIEVCSKKYCFLHVKSGTSSNRYNRYFYPNPWYLATINNLETPVQKTAALTMKITYTLAYE